MYYHLIVKTYLIWMKSRCRVYFNTNIYRSKVAAFHQTQFLTKSFGCVLYSRKSCSYMVTIIKLYHFHFIPWGINSHHQYSVDLCLLKLICTPLYQVLPSLTNLEVINFGDCLVKSKGASAIADAIKTNHAKLKVII